MNNLFKFLAVVLILVGEVLAILAELFAAKYCNNFLKIILPAFLVILIASLLLVAGYALGFKYFKNIWIVSVISLASILFIEPVLDYIIFGQIPTKGALIGLVLGILGFASAIFLK